MKREKGRAEINWDPIKKIVISNRLNGLNPLESFEMEKTSNIFNIYIGFGTLHRDTRTEIEAN